MPTRGRPGLVQLAIERFLAQDYPARELVVVVDPDDASPQVPRDVVVVRTSERLTVGAKRNVACERARGALVAHWDDDDWYPRSRLSRQVAALGDADLTGTSVLLYFRPVTGHAFVYARPRAGWVAGSSFLFRRSYWCRHPFSPVSVGEDARFLQHAAVREARDPELCIALLHSGNTSPKRIAPPYWRALAPTRIRAAMGTDIDRYRAVTSSASPEPTASSAVHSALRAWR